MDDTKYYVTYCVMDLEAGANPFGHACIILSKQTKLNGPIEAFTAFGFYAEPSSSKDIIIQGLKKLTGFNINLQNSHGTLKEEPMRYFDTDGLYGVSVEVSHKKILELQQACRQDIQKEQLAIAELNIILQKANIPQNGYTRLGLEKHLAELENREPRLKEFGFYVSPFLSTDNSKTCKKRALDILAELNIFQPELIAGLNGSSFDKAFPVCSQVKLRPMKFVPAGSPSKHTSKRTGKIYYFFEWLKHQLFFATPINLYQQSSKITNKEQELLVKTLNDLSHMRELLLRHLDGLSEIDNIHTYQHHLLRIKFAFEAFYNVHDNIKNNTLYKNLANAKFAIIQAEAKLFPNEYNTTFIMRFFSSVNVMKSAIGMILIAATLFTAGASFIGLSLATTSFIYSTYKGYQFYNSEKIHAEKMDWFHKKSQSENLFEDDLSNSELSKASARP